MKPGRIFNIARNRIAVIVSALGVLFVAGLAGQAAAVSGAPSAQQVAKKDCDKQHDGDRDHDDHGCKGYHGHGQGDGDGHDGDDPTSHDSHDD